MLLVAGWALLLAAWIGGNPPFAAPDEEAHYVRTLGVAEGRLVGPRAPARPEGVPGLPPELVQRRARWAGATTTRVPVAARLLPPQDCYLSDPRRSAACLRTAPAPAPAPAPATAPGGTSAVSATGTYQPLPYLLPAAVVGAADGPRGANRLARIAVAVPALALLAAAAWVLVPLGALALAGLLAAVTPMVLFSAASLTGSGLEIPAAIAFAAALAALVAGPGARRRGAWILAATAGAALALSRSTGPVWAVLLLLLVPVVLGGVPRPRRPSRAAVLAGAALLAAFAVNRVWEGAHGPEIVISLAEPRSATRGGLDQLRAAAPQWVGGFGYLEFGLPGWVVGAWGLLVAGLVALGARRRPILLLAVLAVAGALPVALYVAMVRHTGYGLQGRHVLPVVAALPLLAGVLAARGGHDRRWVVAAGALAAAAQLGAWWANARRAAVGIDGPWWFPASAEWAPPGGWTPWALLAAGGAGLLLIASIRWAAPSQTPSSSAG